MTKTPIFVAAGTAVVALTPPVHAQGVDERGSGSPADAEPTVEVRNRSEWAAIDDTARPPDTTAILRPRLVLPETYGTWAKPPASFATTPVALFAGELALSSRWSAVFEGAKDSLDQRFSGGVVGLRLHLTEKDALTQLSFSGGAMRDLIGESGLWSQLNVSHEMGRWRFAGVLRAHGLAGAALTPGGASPSYSGSAGVSYDLGPARVGLEYAGEISKVAARSAIMSWVAMPIAKGPFQLRLTAAVPTYGDDGTSLRLLLVADF